MLRKTIVGIAALAMVAGMGQATVIIDAATNHGSFESPLTGDPDDSGDTIGTRVNQVTGWTAVDTGWSMFTHSSYVVKSVTDGEYGLSANDGVSATVTSDAIAFALTAGELLTLTFDMGVNSTVGGVGSDNFTGNAYFDGGSAVTFGTQQVTSTVDLGSGLYRDVYSSTIAVPANASSLVIDLVVQNSSEGASQAYLDNVQLDVIPEPSTLALLGLGGLVMALRRKR